MTNAAPAIRKALKVAVTALSYGGGTVPFYDNEGGSEAYQVIVGEISRSDNSTKHTNAGEYSVVVEVVSEQENTAARKEVDEIGGLVMNAIATGPRGQALSLSSPLQLVRTRLIGQDYLTEDSEGDSKIVRLLLRYQFNIVETV